MTFLTILLLLVVGAAVYVGVQFNAAQAKALKIEGAMSNIKVVMKKRFDLINKLMDVVSSYVDHEQLTHLAIVKEESAGNLARASVQADGALTQLNSIARNYPDLKANASYSRLMDNLTEVEAEIQSRREAYNWVVLDYNTFISAVPFMFFAPSLKFHKAPSFDVANADSLENTNSFSANDGAALRDILTHAGGQVLRGTKEVGNLLERGQAKLQKHPATPAAPEHGSPMPPQAATEQGSPDTK